MDWEAVCRLDPIYLNLGGGRNCHPNKFYRHYVSVDLKKLGLEWMVNHDLREPLPLPGNSVDRVLTEDFLEHLPAAAIKGVLAECYRVLKPGARMRIGVPDYSNPKDRAYLEKGEDPRYPGHVTLTTYPLMRQLIEASPFTQFTFYQYWDDGRFVWSPVDYSQGIIQRTPENYYRYFMRGIRRQAHAVLLWLRFLRSKDMGSEIAFGHPLYATELVVDLVKPGIDEE